MKKFLLSLLLGLLNKFVISIVFNIASPIVFAFISKFSTGDWFKLLHNPLIDCIFGLLLVWFVASFVYKILLLRKNNRASNSDMFRFGGETIGPLSYKEVIWRIKGDRDHKGFVIQRSLYADTPAMCPKCRTELEEYKKILGSYKWKCIDCGFEKINKNNFYFEAGRAGKIARRDAENAWKLFKMQERDNY
ncbi:hypothetical protein BSF_40590 [Bacillus subtilis]|nr:MULTISPECIES: hypothetical protein [Bacillus]BDG82330.1 hypothetical protein BSF_40590 [Bacillus subtilis]OEC78657.1 hypothetical protein BCV60_09395 [Bacillus halotolerans]PHI45579.1 hypothetical protein B9T64_20410 [Bacillus halotolerans]UZD51521.1 hypothetical protein OMK57_20825 [Bacillus halotolerans]WEY45180.1 hypothetical protein P3L57_20490 [Bacillus sp. B28]